MSGYKCNGCHNDMRCDINVYEGLCHDCWRKANPKRTCEFCINARFDIGEDGEELIDCKAGIEIPLDCYALRYVPEGCEKQILKMGV